MTLELVTAGESHGPALVAIETGLPAGLVLERESIDRDLRRRQEGYGRSPRQRIESDEVEVRVVGEGLEQRVDEARADRDTVGGVVEVRARGVPPGLGSYATKADRLDARLAATLMGTQAVKGVEIGEGFALAGKRGSEAHDEIYRDDEHGLHRETNHAGGIEAGVSDGEEIVVRAAMKPLPTLMQPLASVNLQTGEPAEALVERSDTAAIEALAVVAEACVAWELARGAREKFGGDSLGDFLGAYRAYRERIDWQPRTR